MKTIDDIIEDVLRAEGGYVNDAVDRGGETNFGITIATARQNGYSGPMRDLPRDMAKEMYRRQYGREIRDVPVEAVTFRVNVGSPPARDGVPRWPRPRGAEARRGHRPVYFAGAWTRACPVYDRYALAAGTRLRGPAVVEERESTTIVPPAARLHVDPDLNLVIALGGRAPR